ncbi:MAG: heavy metal sensor histidine kinase [Hyphomonadaceae bacterium JAD_PAG50586_4]|nr:MAG: heavy metal sensor histidine kinase [Hyphomonadaceae bacterium JAD_PAG50586_4]
MLYLGLITQSSWIDDQTMEKRYLTVRGILNSEGERDIWLAHEVSEDMEGPRRVFLRVLMDDGSVLQETPDMAAVLPSALLPRIRTGQDIARGFVTSSTGRRFRVMVAGAPVVVGGVARAATTQIAIDTTLDELVLRRFEILVVMVAIVALLATVILSALHFARLLEPLERMTNDVGDVDQNSLNRRIETMGMTDELSALGAQFNAMLDRLQSAYQRLRQYADNVAHEICTPLNKLILGLNVAEQQTRSPDEYKALVGQLSENCRELSTLVERLLFLARASSGQIGIRRQLVDVQMEIETIGELYRISASEAGVRLTVERGDSVAVSADRSLLQRAITNLVSNAISHTPAGGEVRLSARQVDEAAEIEVADTGSGIPAADLPFVFDRFYRADPGRSASGHVGLGLPIAKSIVDLHEGEISLKSTQGAGTCARVSIPVAGARARAPMATLQALRADVNAV